MSLDAAYFAENVYVIISTDYTSYRARYGTYPTFLLKQNPQI